MTGTVVAALAELALDADDDDDDVGDDDADDELRLRLGAGDASLSSRSSDSSRSSSTGPGLPCLLNGSSISFGTATTTRRGTTREQGISIQIEQHSLVCVSALANEPSLATSSDSSSRPLPMVECFLRLSCLSVRASVLDS